MRIQVEVWMSRALELDQPIKVATGLFIFVAIDEQGKPRKLPPQ
jgi:acyl-CoA hydrolase